MEKTDSNISPIKVLKRSDLTALFDALHKAGYTVIGPTIRDRALVYTTLATADELPAGYHDDQEAGTYLVTKTDDPVVFGCTVASTSWKRFLHEPTSTLFEAHQTERGFTLKPQPIQAPKQAFIGVRPCEVAAIAIQDRVLMHSEYVDPAYAARRNASFFVAVNCTRAGGTCFCTSMETGPRAKGSYDLCLTEVHSGESHYFLVEIGSTLGGEIAAKLPTRKATKEEAENIEQLTAIARDSMGRRVETEGLKEMLQRNAGHPRWQDVEKRCLTCANCTLVCPTCFCTTVEDTTDLTGSIGSRSKRWDSCFTVDFSYIHGGSVRPSARGRYRHWLMHKLANWVDQFGSMGCVGCGRCITWCPVGIDITEEVRAIRQTEHQRNTTVRAKEPVDANT